MNTAIVIPTYNEKNNIRPLVKEILDIAPDVKIIIVDDNSPDGTGKIADELAGIYQNLKVTHRKKREGLGKAYITGFKEALKMSPDYIMQMDADFSHNPKYIPLFLKEITGCDVVIGSRFIDGHKRPANVSFLSLWAKGYATFILGLKITDCLGGFKCFSRKVAEEVELDKFISKGFVFQVEFIYRSLKKGFLIHEIPIVFCQRKSGLTKKSHNIICEAFFKVLLFKLFLRNRANGVR